VKINTQKKNPRNNFLRYARKRLKRSMTPFWRWDDDMGGGDGEEREDAKKGRETRLDAKKADGEDGKNEGGGKKSKKGKEGDGEKKKKSKAKKTE
jgi:hypothetical protein